MREVTGKIVVKDHKDWNQIRLYSFQIEGDPRWFRTGKTEIEQPEGATVSFTERNNQVIKGSVNLTGDQDAPCVVEDTTTAPTSVGTQLDVGQRIRWQAARRDAVSIVVAALHTEALPWATNTAKGKKLDLLRGYINELASQFLEDENNG